MSRSTRARDGGRPGAGRGAVAPRSLVVPVRAAFDLVARLRPGGRAVHSDGAVFAGEVEVPLRAWRGGVDGLDAPGRWPAVVRFSRGLGAPRLLPDVLGLAVRVESPAGPRDVLVDSVLGPAPGRRRIGTARQDHLTATYGSILGYRLGEAQATVVLLALPVPGLRPPAAGRGRLRDLAGAADLRGAAFDLAVAGRGGGPVVLARLHLGDRVPDGTEPHFDPTASGTLFPAGPLGRLRAGSYPAGPLPPR